MEPTNSTAYARNPKKNTDPGLAEWETISAGSDNLARIGDKSAVKYLIQMLDYDGGLEKRFAKPLAAYSYLGASPKTMAGTALWKMKLPDAPTNGPGRVDAAFIKAWKGWWELRKDYYEKLEFGQPAPSFPPTASQTNTVAVPSPSEMKKPPLSVRSTAPHVEDSTSRRWWTGIIMALAALLGGAMLWRARRR